MRVPLKYFIKKMLDSYRIDASLLTGEFNFCELCEHYLHYAFYKQSNRNFCDLKCRTQKHNRFAYDVLVDHNFAEVVYSDMLEIGLEI